MPYELSRRAWIRAAAGAAAGGAAAGLLSACGTATPVSSASASASSIPAPTFTSPSATPTPTPTPTLAQLSITDPASNWVVVDKLRPLNPIDFVPELAAIAVAADGGALRMRPDAAAAMAQLAPACLAEAGVRLGSASDYRSYAFQVRVYNQTKNDTLTAHPGYSEHQTGLAIDFSSPAEGGRLSVTFAKTKAGMWLAANAWRFGFLLRYPEGLQPITGYQFEPWHYRYIGVPLATVMHDRGVATLEEYFGLPAAPNYPG